MSYGLSEEEILYNEYHRRRFAFTRKVLRKFTGYALFVLEVGGWGIKQFLIDRGCIVDSLGFYDKRVSCPVHYEVNLSYLAQGFPKIETKYDLILCCEVIEHLPVNMNIVFDFFNSLLYKDGLLYIQTPNAVSLKNRLSLLFGRNPMPLIRKVYDHIEHDHIREYTLPELIKIAKDSGFEVVVSYRKNYFGYSHSWKARLYKLFSYLLPGQFKDGITLLLQKR